MNINGEWMLIGVMVACIGCGGADDENENQASSGGAPAGGSSAGGTSTGGTKTNTGGTESGGTSAGGGGIAAAGAGAGAGGAPSGGIAEKYPGDQGIENDPDVIFADDFESYSSASDLKNRWDYTIHPDHTRIASETGNVFAGKQSLEFTLPVIAEELSDALHKMVSPELDAMYLRYYSKFDLNFDITGSSHNGGGMSAHSYIGSQATAGTPADGTNKFSANFEDWRVDPAALAPGKLNVYTYHPEQRDAFGDHFFPTGVVLPNSSVPFDFGPDFVAEPDVVPELDHWYCYEFMVKANTPGQRDGRFTLWLDGKQIADFGNLRLRDVDALKIDRFILHFHAHKNAKETKKYYDNVVAAKSYIGPMAKQP